MSFDTVNLHQNLYANVSQAFFNSLSKNELLELYKKHVEHPNYTVNTCTDQLFDRRIRMRLKALRDIADTENKEKHKSSAFWNLGVKIDERANTYSKLARTESIGCLFQALHIDTLGNDEIDAKFIQTRSDGEVLLWISGFDVSSISDSVKKDVLRFYPNTNRFDFFVKCAAPTPNEVSVHTNRALLATARHQALEKIVSVEGVRAQLEEHLDRFSEKFVNVKNRKLEASSDDEDDDDGESESDEGEEEEEDEGEGSTKQRRTTFEKMGTSNKDRCPQLFDDFAVEVNREAHIRTLLTRTRTFKDNEAGDAVEAHKFELLGVIGNRHSFRDRLPHPVVPSFKSGVAVEEDGVSLQTPDKYVFGNHTITKKLAEFDLLKPYEDMLRMNKELKTGIEAIAVHMTNDFHFFAELKNIDGSVSRITPESIDPASKYAIGCAYMDLISTRREFLVPADDGGEEDEEELEEDSEGEGSEYEEGESEESEESEDGEDSDDEYVDSSDGEED